MSIYKDKIDTKDLQVGMYVSKLDRSWLDTPFPFQGFFIRSKTEIQELQIFCKHVYVDAEQGSQPYKESEISKPSPLLLKKEKILKHNIPANKFRYTHVNIGKYDNKKTEFKREINKAKTLFSDLSYSMQQLSFNLRVGVKLDYKKTKELTKGIVKSVIRNPNSLIWLSRLKEKGEYTYNHSLRSCILATVFGRYLGLSEDDLFSLSTGVLLADIGKTTIKRDLLNSRQKPTTADKLVYQSHVESGVEILAKNRNIEHRILVIAETHHERYNGSGYPYALVGNEIPYFGQIAGIVDVFDALTNKKSYGEHMTTAEAMDWLYHQRGILFSSELVDDFINAIGLYPPGTLVELTDSSRAIVVSHNPEKRLRPKILLLQDYQHNKLARPKKVDLSKRSLWSKKDRPTVVRALLSV
jgi:HD-GYP domain-containing protein (c-di-GMP phosphodiesterase class II)